MSYRMQLFIIVIGLMLVAASCSKGKGLSTGGTAFVPGSNSEIQKPSDDSIPATLDEVLKAIIEAEKGYDPATRDRQTSALPATLLGDQEWMKGATAANYERNTTDHWLKVQGASTSIESNSFMGFAVYRFQGHLGENFLSALSKIEVVAPNNFYIYVVDFSGMPKWRQYGPYGQKPDVMPPGGYDFPLNFGFNAVSSNGNVYIAYGVYGTNNATVTSISLDTGGPLMPPVAILDAAPVTGAVPLTVSFNASQSYDPDGSPLTFEWDFDGDGVYDLFSGTTPFAEHVYTGDGVYVAKVRVRDVDDDVGIAWKLINAGDVGYYEVEPNDIFSQSTPLPPFDFPDPVVLGSLGQDIDAGYGGYDGDYVDNYSFQLPGNSFVIIEIGYDAQSCDLTAGIFDTFEVPEGELFYENDRVVIEAYLTRTTPYYLKVSASAGFTDYTISGFRIPGSQPIADLNADKTIGLPPLTVNFDASGSSDPDGGDIVKFEWDFDGDGNYDLDSGDVSTVQHIYSTPGIYTVTVRVTDDEGARNRDSIEITVREPFFEVEDNDTPAQANELPPFEFPEPLVTGSIGDGPGYEEYDGDSVDWFTFATTQQGAVQFTLEYTSPFGGIFLSLFDSDINLIAESIDGGGLEYIQAQLPSAGTYYLLIDTISGFGDYELSGRFAPGSLPVARVSASPRFGNLPLEVNFDASASSDPDGGALTKFEWDFDGDGIFDLDSGSDPTVDYTYETDGSFQARVRVTDNEGATGEAVIAIVAGSPTYFEIEPNNNFAQANVLPLFPFPSPTVNGNVGPGGYDGGNDDYFVFTTTQSGTPEFSLTYNRFAGKVALVLYDEEGQLVYESRIGHGVELINEDVPAGKYYLLVERFSTGIGNIEYQLAGRFAAGQRPIADISADQESGGTPLTVNFNASGSFDPDGGAIQVFEWDFNGDGVYDENTGTTATTSYEYTSAGVFRATVRVTDNEGARDTAFVYIFAGTSFYEDEDNDSFAEANVLPDLPFPAPTINGNLGYSGINDYDGDSEDYFSFEVMSSGIVSIAVTFDGTNCNIDAELFDADQAFLAGSYSNGSAENIAMGLDPGTYYLRLFVGTFDPGGTGASDYEIVISTS